MRDLLALLTQKKLMMESQFWKGTFGRKKNSRWLVRIEASLILAWKKRFPIDFVVKLTLLLLSESKKKSVPPHHFWIEKLVIHQIFYLYYLFHFLWVLFFCNPRFLSISKGLMGFDLGHLMKVRLTSLGNEDDDLNLTMRKEKRGEAQCLKIT